MEDTETLLMKRIRDGDKPAYEIVFNTYYTRLCVYAQKFLYQPHVAEEVVIDVLFKFWQRKNEIDIKTSLKAYLFSSVYHASIDYLRKVKHEQHFISIDDEEYAPGKYEFAIEENCVSGLLEKDELEDEIKKAIDDLPPECKKIFLMSREQDLSYKKIASELDLSVKTVETQMSRALRKLRDKLIKYFIFSFFF